MTARNKEVFQRLYENQHSLRRKRCGDHRPAREKEIEDQCTFRPTIVGDSPFISERTLRNMKQGNRRIEPSNVPRPVRKSTGSSDSQQPNALIGGMYTKSGGLVRGPPTMTGVPVYFFDPFNPPSFNTGSYVDSKKVIVAAAPVVADEYEEVWVDEEITSDETVGSSGSNQVLPPPLPSWANSQGGDPSRKGKSDSAPKKLVIKKSDKKIEAPAPTGWQAVLAEMNRKKEEKNGGKSSLKKVANIEKPAPQKTKVTCYFRNVHDVNFRCC